MIRVLSLGAGVQSSTVLLLSCRGDLPKLDAAIFADTQWEPPAVYEHLSWLEAQAGSAGIPVYRVTKGNLRADYVQSVEGGRASGGRRFASLPVFTSEGDERGMVRRQCTKEYKIEPIRRKIRELLGLKYGQRAPLEPVVEQWFGISADETRRARLSQERWIVNRYPLIFDLPMARSACVAWLRANYPDRLVPRSACVGCPFHSDAEWRQMRDERPEEWADALAFDAAIRTQDRLRSEAFLHAARVPLAEAPIDRVDPRQRDLWDQECQGMCGV